MKKNSSLTACYRLRVCRIKKVMCLGVSAGAYVLTLFAVGFQSVTLFFLRLLTTVFMNLLCLPFDYAGEIFGTSFRFNPGFSPLQSSFLD